jgi:hypothetical protein
VTEPWVIATESSTWDYAEGTLPLDEAVGFVGRGEQALSVIATRGKRYRVQVESTSGGEASYALEWATDAGPVEVLDGGVLPASLDVLVESSLPGRQLTLRLSATEGLQVQSASIAYEEWVEVPDEGNGVLDLAFVVHVESIPAATTDEASWRRAARAFEGLVDTFAAHGAGVTVQADTSLVAGAAVWDLGWLDGLAAKGAGFSVHLHDEEDGEEGLEQAARSARQIWNEAGFPLHGLNGGFQLAAWNLLKRSGYSSLSAFKDPTTQSGLPTAGVLPWRPAEGAGTADVERFLEHDPDGPLVYLAGALEREAAHDRFGEVASRRLSQMLAHTREGEINTTYILSHVDLFGPVAGDGADLDAYLDGGGFDGDLALYDAWLTERADPLVASGRVRWTTLEEVADRWLEKEANCEP